MKHLTPKCLSLDLKEKLIWRTESFRKRWTLIIFFSATLTYLSCILKEYNFKMHFYTKTAEQYNIMRELR